MKPMYLFLVLLFIQIGYSEVSSNSIFFVEKRSEFEISPMISWDRGTESNPSNYSSSNNLYSWGNLSIGTSISFKFALLSFLKIGLLLDLRFVNFYSSSDIRSIYYYFNFGPTFHLNTPTKFSIFIEAVPFYQLQLRASPAPSLEEYRMPDFSIFKFSKQIDLLLSVGFSYPIDKNFRLGVSAEMSIQFGLAIRPTFSFLF